MPTINDGSKHFQAVTYTGNGSTNTITGFSFQPDFVWIKGRSGATDHAIYDAVRGTTLDLASNTTAAETTQSTGLTAFNSTGFTLGALSKVNTNGATYVAWGWNAGGSTVSNTSGSITSQVRANPTAGFSVVTYTGTGANANVGHGLGVAPGFIIIKRRTGSPYSWPVYHSGFSGGANDYLILDGTQAKASNIVVWNNTNPTSSVFSIGTDAFINGSGAPYVAYCFAPVAGYSAFGSFVGNNSADGPYVFLNFRPKFILIKGSTNASHWAMFDSSRDTYNVAGTDILLANSSGASITTYPEIDFLSNGFKVRATDANSYINAASQTYIYAAFAENPFRTARAR